MSSSKGFLCFCQRVDFAANISSAVSEEAKKEWEEQIAVFSDLISRMEQGYGTPQKEEVYEQRQREINEGNLEPEEKRGA